MSESEDTQRGLEWNESPTNGLSLQLNAECKAMDPDLTPLDEDSSSEMSAEGSNRWHLPLTDDDAVISNVDTLEDSVDIDEMSVSTHRETKKRRVDSGSRSRRTPSGRSMKAKSVGNVAAECRSRTPMQSVGGGQPGHGGQGTECGNCAARRSDVLHVGGVHVSGLDMARLMDLEAQLLTGCAECNAPCRSSTRTRSCV